MPQRVVELAAEEQVGRGIDVVGQGERLVDGLDVEGLGVARVADRDRLAVDAGSRRESAGCAPDSTRMRVDLPAPLPPTMPMTSPGVQVDGDVVDGVDATERDADVAHLDERRALRDASSIRSSCAHQPRRRL